MNVVDALVVTLGLDSSGFDRGQKSASDNLGRMSSDAKRTQQSFDSMASSMTASSNAMRNSMAGLPVLLHEIYGAIVRMTEQITGVKQMTLSLEDFNGLAEQAAKEAREAADAIDDLGESARNAADNINDAGNSLDDASEKTQRLSEEGKKLGREFSRSGDQMARSLRGVANELISVFALSKGGSFLGGKVVDSIQGQADTGRKAANMGLSANELKTQEWLIQRQGGSSEEARQSLGNFYGALTAAQNSPEIPDWLQFLRSRGVQLVDEKGGFTKPDKLLEDMADAFDSAELDQKTRKFFMQQMGFSDSYATLVGKGSGYIRQQTSEIEGQTGLTPEGVKNTQEFQRQSIEALQGLEGAWNKFIGENAPALTQALTGITNEFSKFGKEISDSLEDFNKFKKKYVSNASAVDQVGDYLGLQIIKAVTGKSDEEAAATNKWLNETYSGKKQAPDGILYDPSELEGGPDDSRWNSLWYFQKSSLESRIQTRDAGEVPWSWQGDQEQRTHDEAVWAEHQKRLEWEKKQTELIEKNGYKAVYPDPSTPTSFEQKVLPSPDRLFNSPSSSPVALSNAGSSELEKMKARIIRQESGGDDYRQSDDKKGRWKKGDPMRSEVGALYSRQVMPATANSPGFGILAARDNSPEEYNRVGDELMKALYNYYGGNTDKAMAAYHSGFGFVDKLVAKAAKSGGDWREGLGPKGRDYIGYKPISKEEQRAVAGMQKLMQSISEAQSMRSSNQQQPFLDVPPQIRAQTSPAMSPGVQQAMGNDNRTITSTATTHIDNVNVHVPGGNPKEIAGSIGSALQRHPLINGANYA